MDAQAVKALLDDALENCQIDVQSEGSHFNVHIVGDVFSGKRPVQRQQLIYAVLNEHIAQGTIHAVNMTTLTPEEFANS